MSMPLLRNTKGFTIVELLIVIVVIAILAAISIVAYNGVQTRANNSTVKSDLNKIIKKMELAKIDLGRYPNTVAEIPSLGISKGAWDQVENNAYYCLNTDTGEYAFGARSKARPQGYAVSSTRGLVELGSIYGETTCQLVGKSWGASGTFVAYAYNGPTAAWQGWAN